MNWDAVQTIILFAIGGNLYWVVKWAVGQAKYRYRYSCPDCYYKVRTTDHQVLFIATMMHKNRHKKEN